MNKRKNIQTKIRRLAFLAMLCAVVLVMSATPIGYLRVGPVEITFLAIPVVIGSIVMGPLEGGIIGAVFGATSFAQFFGIDPMGTAFLAFNPFFSAIMCFVPRILIGVFSGLVYRGMAKHFFKPLGEISEPVRKNFFSRVALFVKLGYRKIRSSLPYIVSAFVGSITNSIFFTGFLLLFFFNTPEIQAFGSDVLTVLGVMITANVFIEAAVCLVVSASLSSVFHFLTKKYSS